MIVCDRCLSKQYSKVITKFEKAGKNGKKGHIMLTIENHLCEECIKEFLKAFGKFKVQFNKEGDQSE